MAVNPWKEETEPKGARIVVIEDEPVLRLTFRRILERHGHQVWDAENGVEGLSLCREQLPDLVITDLIMPELPGDEAVRILREEFPSLPVIAISGAGETSGKTFEQAGEATRFASKPVAPHDLVDMVDSMLAGPRQASSGN
jgi:twitching motility two-component system response regulator PilH